MATETEKRLADTNERITGILSQLSIPGGDNQENRNTKDALLGLRDRLISQVQQEKALADYRGKYGEAQKAFEDYSGGTIDKLKSQIAPERSRLIAEEAALGRLGSPVARESLNKFDVGARDTMANLISKLAGQKAALESQEAEGELGYSEFGQKLGLEQQSLADKMAQFQKQLELDSYLGRRKLDILGEGPSTLDKIKTGFDIGEKGLNILGKLGKMGKSIYDS